jgi:diacylglycerol O-acyltransferase
MRMLSGLDASFIYLESDHSPMHIGGVYLINADTAPKNFGFDRFRDHIENRLVCSGVFRQRLVEVPLSLSHPYWINDPDFKLSKHLPRLQLHKPGGMKEVMQLSAQVFGTALDRSQPLWELSFVEGLNDFEGMAKNSFAIITKVHHAAVDGGSGVELMGALLDLEPKPRVIERKDEWQPEELPTTAKAVAAAYSKMGKKSVEFGKLVSEVAAGAVQVFSNRRARRISPPTLPFSAPVSILNRSVTSSRTYWGVDFAFDRIRAIRQQVPAATINDVVLAICASGLRNYLLERDELPDKPLVTMAPISVRKENQKGEMGNQVSAMLVSLATDIADPLERLLLISGNTKASKSYSSALPANKITEFIPSETLAAAARLYTRTRMGGRHRPCFFINQTKNPGPPVTH